MPCNESEVERPPCTLHDFPVFFLKAWIRLRLRTCPVGLLLISVFPLGPGKVLGPFLPDAARFYRALKFSRFFSSHMDGPPFVLESLSSLRVLEGSLFRVYI